MKPKGKKFKFCNENYTYFLVTQDKDKNKVRGIENLYNIDVMCINCNEMINVDLVGTLKP